MSPAAGSGDAAAAEQEQQQEAARRRQYNRMRHERDRANRKARVQAEMASLTEAEVEARRERGRHEAAALRAAVAAVAAAEQKSGHSSSGGSGGDFLHIAIDCAYSPDGSDLSAPSLLYPPQAVRSLATQMQRSVAAVKRAACARGGGGGGANNGPDGAAAGAARPRVAVLHATSFGGPLAAAAEKMGAAAWPLFRAHAAPLLHVFPPGGDGDGGESDGSNKLVVLSPDAELPLPLDAPLDGRAVYVVGGIVDRSVKRGMTLGFAAANGLEARRLPVAECAARLGRLSEPGASRRPVLNVSDAVACLLAYEELGDWAEALARAIPRRKLVAGVEGAGRRRPGRRRAAGQGGGERGGEETAAAAGEA